MPDFDYHDALIQVEMLFQSHILSFGYKEYSLETFADKKYFSTWKGREGCADTDEMRAGLNIDGILRSADPSDNEVLTYAQYTLNIAELCRRSFNAEETPGYDFDIRNYTELLSRIREILKRLNYEVKYVAEKELIYLVPHDAAAEAIEGVSDDPVTTLVTEYRSANAVGMIDKKKQLLSELADKVSSYDDNDKGGNVRLSNKIRFLLNTLEIQPGDETQHYERIEQMNPGELEDWYDETYQLLLLRILEHSNIARMQRVDELAKECGIEQFEITEEEMAQLLSTQGVPELNPDRSEDEMQSVKEELQPSNTDHPPVSDSHTVRNVVIALIIADILFAAFVLCYLFLV